MEQLQAEVESLRKRVKELEAEKGLVNPSTGELPPIFKSAGSFLEAANVPVFATDANGKFTLFNTAAEKLYNFSREDVIGKALVELLVPKVRSFFSTCPQRHSQPLRMY